MSEITEFDRLMGVSYTDIVEHKMSNFSIMRKDLKTLRDYTAINNERKFCGNKILYNYMTNQLCRVKTKGRSLYEIMTDPIQKKKLVEKAIKLNRSGSDANRLFEAQRFNGAVVFFKPATAKYIYKHFNAESVLDPCAGWGGRLLAAYSLDIGYVGFDTNIDLRIPYKMMIKFLRSENPHDDVHDSIGKQSINFHSCMDADFSEIDYDFVLTSPPYINLEQYPHMTPFENEQKYYNDFLIPLINRCLEHINPVNGGWVCFNINQKMYKDLLEYGMRAADKEENFLQQKKMGKDMEDKVYCWKKPVA